MGITPFSDCVSASARHVARFAGTGLLVNLDTLNLSHNLIRRLPLSIGKLTRLEVLACVGNPLTFPDASVCEVCVRACVRVGFVGGVCESICWVDCHTGALTRVL